MREQKFILALSFDPFKITTFYSKYWLYIFLPVELNKRDFNGNNLMILDLTETNSCQEEINQAIRWSQTVDGATDIQACPNDKEIGKNIKTYSGLMNGTFSTICKI